MSHSAEAFTQAVDAIIARWDMSIQTYTMFRQRTTTSIPELEPSFGMGEPQGRESETETDATPQAMIEAEEVPI